MLGCRKSAAKAGRGREDLLFPIPTKCRKKGMEVGKRGSQCKDLEGETNIREVLALNLA